MIEVKNLRKTFGPIVAVDKVSFTVARGDVLGFLGPNGAGKTTTMKMVSSFLPPDSGTARVLGHDVAKDPISVRRAIGYLAENAPMYEEMSPESFLRFTCEARGMSRRDRTNAVGNISERCAITGVMHQQIGTLSKGFRRRVGLAQALIHNPPVLLLDEPTDGLDPNQKHDVRRLIKEISAEKCIIISTHILEEVEAICNRIVIIDQGRALKDTTPDDLRNSAGDTLEGAFRKLTYHGPTAAGGAS